MEAAEEPQKTWKKQVGKKKKNIYYGKQHM